jgi:hypothetical protein
MKIEYCKAEYGNWFLKDQREMLRVAERVIEELDGWSIHYLMGDEEALPCIAAVVLAAQKKGCSVYGSFIRESADRATGKIEGNPPPETSSMLQLKRDRIVSALDCYHLALINFRAARCEEKIKELEFKIWYCETAVKCYNKAIEHESSRT